MITAPANAFVPIFAGLLGKNIFHPAFCLLLGLGFGMDPQQRDYVVLFSHRHQSAV
jgi:hypothetical protein